MPSIRIVSASMVAAVVVALAMSGVSARAVTSDPSEKPLPLLAGLNPPHHAKAVHVKKFAAKHDKKQIRLVATRAPRPNTQTDAPPADAWPVPLALVPADTATAAPPETSTPDNAPAPSDVLVGGQTVQIAVPDQVNEIDLASRDNSPATTTFPPGDQAATTPAVRTVLATPTSHADTVQNAGAVVGSASWIAQVLAALGGAAAAGAVAWFLIGSGPVRLYS
jgi:hypothetical protein